MLGWLIIISKQTPAQRDVAPEEAEDLARWETRLGGVAWLNDLVTQGKASQLLFGGYPLRYVASARDVFPLIKSGPPPYDEALYMGKHGPTRTGWIGAAVLHQSRIGSCSPDQQLTIDAWDQS
jgi:hypothetical protein